MSENDAASYLIVVLIYKSSYLLEHYEGRRVFPHEKKPTTYYDCVYE